MEYLLIGRFNRPHGLKGEIRSEFYIDDLDDLDAFSAFYIRDPKVSGGYREIKLEKVYNHGSTLVTVISGVTSIEMAEPYRGVELFVNQSELPPTGKDVFYFRDLIGSKAVYDGRDFGSIVDVIEIADRFILVIRMIDGKDLAVPFDESYVGEVSTKEKTVQFTRLDELL